MPHAKKLYSSLLRNLRAKKIRVNPCNQWQTFFAESEKNIFRLTILHVKSSTFSFAQTLQYAKHNNFGTAIIIAAGYFGLI